MLLQLNLLQAILLSDRHSPALGVDGEDVDEEVGVRKEVEHPEVRP